MKERAKSSERDAPTRRGGIHAARRELACTLVLFSFAGFSCAPDRNAAPIAPVTHPRQEPPARAQTPQVEPEESATSAEAAHGDGVPGSELGALRIHGGGNRTSHTHGGRPANIGGGALLVENTGDDLARLEVSSVVWRQVHCGTDTPYDELITPRFFQLFTEGLERYNIPVEDGIELPPGSHQLEISWANMEVYQGCSSFSVLLELVSPPAELRVEIPFQVLRRTPLR